MVKRIHPQFFRTVKLEEAAPCQNEKKINQLLHKRLHKNMLLLTLLQMTGHSKINQPFFHPEITKTQHVSMLGA